MALPSGVVTFIFSDIEGSTKLWESDPDGMRSSLAHHDDIAREVVASADGTIFKHTGDGFAAAFDLVSSGFEAASGFAAALAGTEWPGPTLLCRIGVHAGEAAPTGTDYFGPTVNRAARVMDAGNGGQVVVSEAARRLIQNPDGFSLVDAGEHRLKDLGEPTRLYRLTGTGADDPRQLRTLERAPHNFPVHLSSFVGRESQIEEVADLVRESRLVTLTGIGGVGKTRLSLQVAAEVLGEFSDGAWLVELAPLSEPGFLAETVASAIEVPADPTATAEERLLRFLPDKATLLVIDNCEHLIDDVAALVEKLLRASPGVRVLTTSREGLAVPGEVLWRVPSLRVDDDAAAVELFAERARLVQPGFTVDESNSAVVTELCVRLDGIPLAIELATARLKMLSLEQIAEHLNDRFRLLTGGSRTAVERQRTLRAMMDWSYDLLSDREKALLRRLSVFSDGFDYGAAEAACSGETLPGYEVLDLLGRLVEASVVSFDLDPRPRYGLLETVRQYAQDKLAEAGEADEARRRHAEHYRDVAMEINDALQDGKLEMAAVATDDLANFRSAMTWASEAGEHLLALELATNLRVYFWDRSMFREAMGWLILALDAIDDDSLPLVAEGTAYALVDSTNVGGDSPIEALAERARRVLATADDDLSRGLLSNALGSYEMSVDAERSDGLLAEATALLKRTGDSRWIAPLQNRYLNAWVLNSRKAEAEILAQIDEAEGLMPPTRQQVGRTLFLVLAEEYDAVLAATEVMDPVDDWSRIMMLLYRMQAERATGHPEWALESIEEFTAMPAAVLDGWRGWHRGMAHLQLGEIEEAIEGFTAPGAYNLDVPVAADRAGVAWFWSLIAENRGDDESAAVLMGFAGALSERASVSLLAFDQRLVEEARVRVREALGDAIYEESIAAGASTSWEDLPLIH